MRFHTKKLGDDIVNYMQVDGISCEILAQHIEDWIVENHKDADEVLTPQLFAFDLPDTPLFRDNYIETIIFGAAESEFININWVATLDRLHREPGSDYKNHAIYIYHVAEY